MENKIGLRMVQNGDILLKEVFVPDEDRLPGVDSFQDTNKVLAVSRVLVAWQPIGVSMGIYDMCHRYLQERKQFGVPLAAFQLNQQKLSRMVGNVQAMFLVGWCLCKLYEVGKMTHGHASLGKAWISSKARETASLGRELLGGNGILTDFLVGKHSATWNPCTRMKECMTSTHWSQLGKSLASQASSQLHQPNGAACDYHDASSIMTLQCQFEHSATKER